MNGWMDGCGVVGVVFPGRDALLTGDRVGTGMDNRRPHLWGELGDGLGVNREDWLWMLTWSLPEAMSMDAVLGAMTRREEEKGKRQDGA